VPQWAEIIGLRRGEILKYYEVFHIFAGWLLIGLLLAWITAKARGS
jgi:thiosulfate reductase cytochrome b subunit